MCDNGASECRVRIRVMPSCLFVLLRHWLRVDGALTRQHDARFFVRFGGGGVAAAAATPPRLLRLRRLAQATLPPLPKIQPDDDGRLGGGGAEDTPRPPPVPPPSLMPDEQASAEKLADVPPDHEVTEEIVLSPTPPAGGVAGLAIS